ncbi:isoprenoid synthase domain-containing protein [Bombardia bombarda]|uniref:Terpene synthase n=1 Tax=Bombardia bombarda TaxID=252184 RepID=A0AA40C9H6_9PEZI|nr:isoprenoid synthase domain-containing protein [Bombardia bombarda]
MTLPISLRALGFSSIYSERYSASKDILSFDLYNSCFTSQIEPHISFYQDHKRLHNCFIACLRHLHLLLSPSYQAPPPHHQKVKMVLLQRISIPDIESSWLWPRAINPHLADVDQECNEWAASFGAFSPAAQRAVDKCKFNLLAGMSYPWMSKEQLKSGCDLMNLFFIFDEHSDKSSPEEVWDQGRILMDAFRNPDLPRPEGEWIGGEVARQFWLRITKISTKTFQRRFLAAWEEYMHGVAQEAELRARSFIPDFETYFVLRRATIGTGPSFVLAEIDLDIPDYVRRHPIILELEMLVTDLVAIVNDIVSYNKEQASNEEEHNLITVIMKERHMTVQEAIDFAGHLHTSKVDRFNQLYQELPRWGGPIDLSVQKLIDGIAWWESGNLHWSFESGRYFGKRGLEAKMTRSFYLLPKVKGSSMAGHIGPLVIEDHHATVRC